MLQISVLGWLCCLLLLAGPVLWPATVSRCLNYKPDFCAGIFAPYAVVLIKFFFSTASHEGGAALNRPQGLQNYFFAQVSHSLLDVQLYLIPLSMLFYAIGNSSAVELFKSPL